MPPEEFWDDSMNESSSPSQDLDGSVSACWEAPYSIFETENPNLQSMYDQLPDPFLSAAANDYNSFVEDQPDEIGLGPTLIPRLRDSLKNQINSQELSSDSESSSEAPIETSPTQYDGSTSQAFGHSLTGDSASTSDAETTSSDQTTDTSKPEISPSNLEDKPVGLGTVTERILERIKTNRDEGKKQ